MNKIDTLSRKSLNSQRVCNNLLYPTCCGKRRCRLQDVVVDCTNMLCPYCQNNETKVTDKRDSSGMSRRRRECLKCAKRFTTYERVEWDLSVIKKDGKKEGFDSDKLKKGIERACEKTSVGADKIDLILGNVEARIRKSVKGKEIRTSKIGEIVMAELKKVDKVAYIRFASVYREFADLDDFKDELKRLK